MYPQHVKAACIFHKDLKSGCFFWFPAIWGIFVLLSSGSVEAQPPKATFAPGELIVQWQTQEEPPEIKTMGKRRVLSRQSLGLGAWLYKLRDRTEQAALEALEEMKDNPQVQTVDLNYYRQIFRVPNDLLYPLQWNIKAIQLEKAWDITTGRVGNIVAVIDTGILPDHIDLLGRLIEGRDFITDPENSGDGDGWDDNAQDNGTDDISSSAFHGTHVAGIIGALSNNNRGIVGVDWGCKILPIRALGIQEGKGKDSDIVASINWASGATINGVPVNNHIPRVINLSFGGPGASSILTNAVQTAQARGVIVVAAAGNQNTDATNIYPAAIRGVITIGATQYDGKRAPYSNYGTIVDVMAPGGNMNQILPFKFNDTEYRAGIMGPLYKSDIKQYSYHFFEGTSQAAPMAVGVITLMLSINSSLNGYQVLDILKRTANKKYKCNEGCGEGLIDAAAALTLTTNYDGSTGPSLDKDLPFGYTCTEDSQCKDGICRMISGSKKLCTKVCTVLSMCPKGTGSCSSGLCVPAPGTSSFSPGNPSQGEGVSDVIWGSGCHLSNDLPRKSGLWILAILALMLTLIRVKKP